MTVHLTAILGLLLTSYLVNAACTPAPSTPAAGGSGQCSQSILINARGTGEMPNSQSMAYSAVNSMIQKSVKNSKPYNVIYPAGMMQDSGSGTTDIVNKVQNTLKSDPNACFFLEGYSQGASAVMNALPKLASSANAVRGVSVVGNPEKPGGVQSMMGSHDNDPNFECKVLDICAPGDFLCGQATPGATGTGGHMSYIMDTNTHNKIAKFAIQALTTGIPGCSGSGAAAGGGSTTGASSGGGNSGGAQGGGGLPMLGGMMGRSTGRPVSRHHKLIRRQKKRLMPGGPMALMGGPMAMMGGGGPLKGLMGGGSGSPLSMLGIRSEGEEKEKASLPELQGSEERTEAEERDVVESEQTSGLSGFLGRLKKRLGMGMMGGMNPLSSLMGGGGNPLSSLMGGGSSGASGGSNPLSALMGGGGSNPLSSIMGGRSEPESEPLSLLQRLSKRLMPGMMGGGSSNPLSSIMGMMGGGGGSGGSTDTSSTPAAAAPAAAPAAAGGATSNTSSCGA